MARTLFDHQKQEGVVMGFEYITPFVDSTQSVIESLISSTVKRSAIILKDSLDTNGISATFYLSGSIEGRIVLDIEPELAKKIAGFMNGMRFDQLDNLAVDTICELVNIILRKTVLILNSRGFRLKVSPPYYFIGEKICSGLESICISLITKWGNVRILAAVNEKKGFN